MGGVGEIVLWPEEEKGQNEEGEDGGPFRLRMYLSFAFCTKFPWFFSFFIPLSHFLRADFGIIKEKGQPHYEGIVAHGLLRVALDRDMIWEKIM